MHTEHGNDDARLAVVESRLGRMESALESIDESLKILARVEYQNEALSERLNKVEFDVSLIRETITELKQASAGFQSLVKLVVGAVVIALLSLIGLKAGHL